MLHENDTFIHKNFEYQLARHCSAALAGIKPSNLISFSHQHFPDIQHLISEYYRQFSSTDIRFEILRQNENRTLLLVYRKTRLLEYLSRSDVHELLEKFGYPENIHVCGPSRAENNNSEHNEISENTDTFLENCLTILKKHFRHSDSCPHEIGLFLGYPPGDVTGYMENQGRNCKFCGAWKVYSDVEHARKCFFRYKNCCQSVCRKLEKGFSLVALFATEKSA